MPNDVSKFENIIDCNNIYFGDIIIHNLYYTYYGGIEIH